MFKDLIAGSQTIAEINNGNKVDFINFDNAATTPPLNSVLDRIREFSPYYSSVHRGGGYKSKISSIVYENSRKTVLDFLKADKAYYTAIFLKNTTECINKLSYRLMNILKDKVVLIKYM